jgi:hypothetical protein
VFEILSALILVAALLALGGGGIYLATRLFHSTRG